MIDFGCPTPLWINTRRLVLLRWCDQEGLNESQHDVRVVSSLFMRVRKIARKKKRILAWSGLSAYPSVHPSVLQFVRMEQLCSQRTDFHEILYLTSSGNSFEEIQISLKSDKNNEYFVWKRIYIFLSYLARFFLGRELLQTNVAEKIKTHILCSISFPLPLKSCRLCNNMEKYRRAGQATDDNMAHAHCTLNLQLQIHTLIALPQQQWLHERTSLLH